MPFQGSAPYGTLGGFPAFLAADINPDVRTAEGKTYIAFLLINGATGERFRFEITDVVRTITGSGLDVMAIIIQEGDASSGSIVDANLAQLRFAAEDFVVTELAPGIVLILLERNFVAHGTFMDSADQTSVLIDTDLLVCSTTLALPSPASSHWSVDAHGWIVGSVSAGGATLLRTRTDIVHSGGTIAGTLVADAPGSAAQVTYLSRARSVGVIVGNQTITVNLYAQQSAAGTLTKKQATLFVIAHRED